MKATLPSSFPMTVRPSVIWPRSGALRGFAGLEAKVEFAVLHLGPREPDGFKPPRQLFRVDRHELVSGVREPGPLVVIALRPDQDSAGTQHPQQLGEDAVLDGGRLGVVEYGEAGEIGR